MNSLDRLGASALISCLLLAGCGTEAALPRAADPEAARAVLAQVLDAWKAGGPAAEGVRFVDDDQLAGCKLADYRLAGEVKPLGTSVRQAVTLSLVDRRGKAVRRRAVYHVGTDPMPSVIRQDGP